eukprot:gene38090-49936_t
MTSLGKSWHFMCAIVILSLLILQSEALQARWPAVRIPVGKYSSIPLINLRTGLSMASEDNVNLIQADDELTSKTDPPFPINIWEEYKKTLTTSPLLAKSVASMFGFGLGDIIAQMIFAKNTTFNVMRLFRFALFGALVHGPSGHFFYRWLNKIIPGATPSTVTAKVLVDQVVWAPLFSFLLYAFVGVIGGSTPNLILRKIKKDMWFAVL